MAAVPLAAANGEGPAELVFNHHAIGIVTALGVPWRIQLHPAVRAPGRAGGPARPGPGQLAGHLDQPAGHRHHHHLRVPAVPRRQAAVARLAAGGLGDGRGHRGPDRLVLALSVVVLVAVVVRFRRSHGVERQQLKWFAYGAVIGIPLGLPAEVPFWGPILELVQPPLLFGGLAVGIFRYRLYDIDRLLNRTLVSGLLTVSLAAAYAAGVLVLGGMVSGGRSSSLVVAAVTLAVAAIFQPLRRVIQRCVDRRFNRRAYDAATTIEAFAVRLRQQVDADALTAELLAVVDHTVQPTRASLWLRPAP
jgi:hypothetical protein